MEDSMFGYRGVPITDHPFFVEFGTGFFAETGGDLTKRFRRTGSLSKGNGDGFGREFLGGKQVDLARRHKLSFQAAGDLSNYRR
jgi:hypothetical protein